MHARIRVTNMVKVQDVLPYAMSGRLHGVDTKVVLRVALREGKTALFNVTLQTCKDEEGWRDTMPLNHFATNDKSASKLRRHAFDLQKSKQTNKKQDGGTVSSSKTTLLWLSVKQKKNKRNTQVISHGSTDAQMPEMKNLLFARAVTVSGEIPF